MVPPVRVTAPSPALGVTVPFTKPVPLHVTEAFGVGATTMPVGSVSVKVVSGMVALALGLVSVMVSVVGRPT